MRSKYLLLVAALWSVIPGLLWVRASNAQPAATPPEDAKAVARATADKAQQLYDSGKYEEAIELFLEADRKFHAPTFVLMIARSYEKLGRLRKARSSYQQVLDEKLAHYAPQMFFDAQSEAKKELEALRLRVPTLRVTVNGKSKLYAKMLVDGRPAEIGVVLEQDPGQHTVAILSEDPRDEQISEVVTLEDGAKAQLSFTLVDRRVRSLEPSTEPLESGAEPLEPNDGLTKAQMTTGFVLHPSLRISSGDRDWDTRIMLGYKYNRFVFGVGFDVLSSDSVEAFDNGATGERAGMSFAVYPAVQMALIRSGDERVELIADVEVGVGTSSRHYMEHSPNVPGTGQFSSDSDTTLISPRIGSGIRYWVHPHAAMSLIGGVRWDHSDGHSEDGDSKEDTIGIFGALGLLGVF